MPNESLKAILAKIEKEQDFRLGRLSDQALDVVGITTGNMAIDHIVGVGGLPLGRSVELYGQPSSGKTTCALQTAANFQRMFPERSQVYFDYECAIDPLYCASLGLDIDADNFIFGQPDVFEQSFNALDLLLPTNEIGLVIFDSVASMTPREVLENSVDSIGVAQQARLMSKALKRFNSQLMHANCLAIFLNHVQDVIAIGGRPGMPPRKTTPGGVALKFFASVRIEFGQIGNESSKAVNELSGDEETVQTATKVKVKVMKNKVAEPFKQCIVQVEYGKGFTNFFNAQQILCARKIVVKGTGSIFYFDKAPDLIHPDMAVQSTGNHRPYIKGKTALAEFAKEHPEWSALVCERAVAELAGDAKVSLISDDEDDDDGFGEAVKTVDLSAKTPSTQVAALPGADAPTDLDALLATT